MRQNANGPFVTKPLKSGSPINNGVCIIESAGFGKYPSITESQYGNESPGSIKRIAISTRFKYSRCHGKNPGPECAPLPCPTYN